jgi:hypothetical protein
LAQLVGIVGNNEQAFYAMTGTRARERGIYCKKIKANYASIAKDGNWRSNHHASDRFHLLNLTNLTTRKQTVEFRPFAGSLNIFKVLCAVQVCIGCVQKACWLNTKINYARPASPTGTAALKVMFRKLFWVIGSKTRGHVKEGSQVPFGILDPETHADCVREALRMAAKYDASPV